MSSEKVRRTQELRRSAAACPHISKKKPARARAKREWKKHEG